MYISKQLKKQWLESAHDKLAQPQRQKGNKMNGKAKKIYQRCVKDNSGLTEEQLEALLNVSHMCYRFIYGFKGNMTEMDYSYYFKDENELIRLLADIFDDSINGVLNAAGMKSIDYGVEPEDIPSFSDYEFLPDDERKKWEELAGEGGDPQDMWSDKSGNKDKYDEICSAVSSRIENYFMALDEEHNTDFYSLLHERP